MENKGIEEQLKNIVFELKQLNKSLKTNKNVTNMNITPTNIMIGSEGDEPKKKEIITEYERETILKFDEYKEQIMNKTIKISEK